MLSPDAVLRLPYDASLTRAGIAYAQKSLHYTYDRMHLPTGARLRKIVAGIAVELAFQRWLDARAAPYDRLGGTAFTDKDKYDLRLGGRKCDLKSFLVTNRRKITALRRDPAWLLEAEVLVPADQFVSQTLGENDLYLFGFLAGLETRQTAEIKKAAAAGQPLYLLATLDRAAWLGAPVWQSLGRLIFKSDGGPPLNLEVGGQDAHRAALTEMVALPPRTRVATSSEFFSLLYVHTDRWPGGRVGVHSPRLKDTQLIAPLDWSNLWIYGLEIYLAGWLPKSEFRTLSHKLPAGAATPLYPRTQTDNYAVSVSRLRPLDELIQRVKQSARPNAGPLEV